MASFYFKCCLSNKGTKYIHALVCLCIWKYENKVIFAFIYLLYLWPSFIFPFWAFIRQTNLLLCCLQRLRPRTAGAWKLTLSLSHSPSGFVSQLSPIMIAPAGLFATSAFLRPPTGHWSKNSRQQHLYGQQALINGYDWAGDKSFNLASNKHSLWFLKQYS